MRTLLFTIAFTLLGGCASTVTIEGHTIRSIKNEELSKYIGTLRARQESAVSPDGFLLVRITTAEDLVRMSQTKSLIVDPKVRFCEPSKKRYRLNVSGMSLNGRSLFERMLDEPDRRYDHERTYDVLLYVSLKENTFAKEYNPDLSHAGHDLRHNPEDLCISIGGGNLGTRIYSNTIRVGEDQIRQALKY